MAMIAFLCLPMQLGLEVAIIPPDEFLRRPIIWAELISRHRATITSGPNFAYSVLAECCSFAPIPAASTCRRFGWRSTGPEPIDHRDIADFAAAAARFGMRRSAPMPAMGSPNHLGGVAGRTA